MVKGVMIMFDYDNKEKLVDLLNVDMSGCEGDYAEEMAEYLTYKDVVVLPCRCRDCKHWLSWSKECDYLSPFPDRIETGENCYCSFAERKCDKG